MTNCRLICFDLSGLPYPKLSQKSNKFVLIILNLISQVSIIYQKKWMLLESTNQLFLILKRRTPIFNLLNWLIDIWLSYFYLSLGVKLELIFPVVVLFIWMFIFSQDVATVYFVFMSTFDV